MKNRIILVMILYLTSFSLVIAQNCNNHKKVPKEFYRSGYYEFNMNAGFPYTMFNKTSENWNLDTVLNEIRFRIINAKLYRVNDTSNTFKVIDDYAKAYREIFDSQFRLIPDEPSTCSKDEACTHPMWVKRNAFLALIGIKYEWLQGYKDTFYLMPDALKEEFKDKATASSNALFGFSLNQNKITWLNGADSKSGTFQYFPITFDKLN